MSDKGSLKGVFKGQGGVGTLKGFFKGAEVLGASAASLSNDQLRKTIQGGLQESVHSGVVR